MPRSRSATLLALALLAGCASDGAPRDEALARNVVLFVGDGMGVTTVTAARIFDGQSRGLSGEEHELAFERFDNLALVKTYTIDQQVPESAATATAMVTGRKTRAGVINVGPEAFRGDCAGAQNAVMTPLAATAASRGLATGVVTTTRITHATPASMYARSPDRDWEDDRYLPDDARRSGCRDIARQLVDDLAGHGLQVAMGGGRAQFYGADGGGTRIHAGDDLPAEWRNGGADRHLVTTRAEMMRLRPGDRAVGLFARSHMTYVAERTNDSSEPTLAEMTQKAIELLSADEDGFFLMVEGGRIDHGHHDGKPGYALLETQAFNRAVEAALKAVDLDETLVLVTADHSHVMTMGGYPTRGNPILGLVRGNDRSGRPRAEPSLAADGQPYTTLGYYNGPGALEALPRPRPETGIDARAQALVPVQDIDIDGSISNDETHGGEDVALYGRGPGADRIRGVIEQNRIHTIMLDALGWSRPRTTTAGESVMDAG